MLASADWHWECWDPHAGRLWSGVTVSLRPAGPTETEFHGGNGVAGPLGHSECLKAPGSRCILRVEPLGLEEHTCDAPREGLH